LSAQGRVVLNKESWQLTERNPWFGIGAGGYRYHFPSVQATSEHFKGVENVRHYTFVRDAHNDWLQYYIELGRIGSAIPLAMLLFWLGWFLRHRFWRSPYVLMSALGIGLACLHAGAEFIWQNGACLLLLGIVVFTAARWRECEHVAALEARTEPAAAKR
jgi:O-antigen ligase